MTWWLIIIIQQYHKPIVDQKNENDILIKKKTIKVNRDDNKKDKMIIAIKLHLHTIHTSTTMIHTLDKC